MNRRSEPYVGYVKSTCFRSLAGLATPAVRRVEQVADARFHGVPPDANVP